MARRASHAPRNTGMKCSRVPTKIILHHLVHCSQANSGIGITELSGGDRSGPTPGQAEEQRAGPMRPGDPTDGSNPQPLALSGCMLKHLSNLSRQVVHRKRLREQIDAWVAAEARLGSGADHSALIRWLETLVPPAPRT